MSSGEPSPTRKLMQMEPRPAAVPNRFREALLHVVDQALEDEASGRIGQWLYNHRDRLQRGGDEHGQHRFNHEILNVEEQAADLILPLRRKLIELMGDDELMDQLCVPAFDLRHIEMHATLHHHGAHFVWHDDAITSDGELVETRRLSFCYYMHSTPKMFSGGLLEFMDGTTVKPDDNRLVVFHPLQQHRIQQVECWSSHVLHGRWALVGWLHGDPPDGYVERLPEMRGRPGPA
jgi:hypothetical protein